MIKKILLTLLIVVVLYGTSIFVFPSFAAKVESLIGITGFSDMIRGGKQGFDGAITDIPQVEEFASGAADAKNTLIEGVNTVKEKTDSLRSGAQKIQDTVEEGKQTYDEAKEVFDDASQKIDTIQGIVQDMKTLSSTGSQE